MIEQPIQWYEDNVYSALKNYGRKHIRRVIKATTPDKASRPFVGASLQWASMAVSADIAYHLCERSRLSESIYQTKLFFTHKGYFGRFFTDKGCFICAQANNHLIQITQKTLESGGHVDVMIQIPHTSFKSPDSLKKKYFDTLPKNIANTLRDAYHIDKPKENRQLTLRVSTSLSQLPCFFMVDDDILILNDEMYDTSRALFRKEEDAGRFYAANRTFDTPLQINNETLNDNTLESALRHIDTHHPARRFSFPLFKSRSLGT